MYGDKRSDCRRSFIDMVVNILTCYLHASKLTKVSV